MAETLSDRLRLLIGQRGITQKDLSVMAGVTEAAVSHYLKGDRVPGTATLSRLADALGVTPGWLMDGGPFGEADELGRAVDTVERCAGYMTYEQKIRVASAMLKPHKEDVS